MIQIPPLFQKRINNIIKEYENRITQVNDQYAAKSDHYYKKLESIKDEMQKIYDDEDISPVIKGEKFVKLTATFEEYVEKYEEPKRKINEIYKEFESEIKKIADMIQQYKPTENSKDINDAVIKYIIKNSK